MVVVAGKGGVGKTTVSAVLARAAARSGIRTLLVDLQGRRQLAMMVGGEAAFEYDVTAVDAGGVLHGVTLTPARALAEYLDQHGLRRVSKRLVTTGVLDVVSTAAPGIDDLLVLGKLKQIERSGSFDLIVVDGPPAGHAVQFLLAARALRDAVSGGPIGSQADDVLAMLADAARCRVLLVTVPETTPVNELVETAEALTERVGAALGPVIVNAYEGGGLPSTPRGQRLPKPVTEAARFRRARCELHAAEVDRLATLWPAEQVRLPWLPVTAIGPSEVEVLAEHLLGELAPR